MSWFYVPVIDYSNESKGNETYRSHISDLCWAEIWAQMYHILCELHSAFATLSVTHESRAPASPKSMGEMPNLGYYLKSTVSEFAF